MKILTKSLLCLLFCLCSTLAFSQAGRTVTGRVTDSTGTGLAGVTVTVKGTTTSTTSDNGGQFSILVPSAGSVLVFSSVGFAPQEVAAADGPVLVTLASASGTMNEVVVTAFGVGRRQKALGYATSTIAAEELTRTGSPNFANALYGKAPGVRIAATPGGATSAVNITIRGINTITGRSQPLIVMDGIPIRNGEANNGDYWNDQRLRGNGLLDINPEDIENISILKGASAAALYGAEAINGVVLITTKSGRGRKGLNVDFNANYSQDRVAYLPRYQNVRGPGIHRFLSNGGQEEDGFVYQDLDGDGVKETRGVGGFSINFGPRFDGKPTLAWDGVIRPYVAQEDNYAGLFQTAHNSNINVAVSQGSENGNIRFSLTRQQNQGVSLGAENTKNIANLNSTFRLGTKWSTDVMVNYINQQTNNRPYSIDRMMNNFTGMMGRFDNADWYLDRYKTSRGYRFVTGAGTQSLTPEENIIYPGFKGDIADYVWRVKEHREVERDNRVIASMTNNWQILSGLKLRGRIATDFTSQRTESRQSTEIPLAFGNSGYFGLGSFQSSIVYGDVLLTYTKKLSSDIEANVMGGYTATKENATYLTRGTSGGLSTENLFDIAASINSPASSSSSRTQMVRDAFLGTLNASYKNYLFLEGTVRRDRVSVMHPDNNAFVYPSVNSSFVFSDAFELPAFFSYGKVRASWGIVGGYPEMYRANIAYNQNSFGIQAVGGKPVLYTTISSDFGNDLIRPEEKHEIEFGLEAKFFKNRLNLDVSYYNGQIRDQILPLSLAATTGARSVLTNIGTLRNKGIEVGISGIPVQTSNFRWDAGINAAWNRNTVESLSDGATELLHADYDGNAAQLKSVVGQPMGDIYIHPVATNAKGEKIVGADGLYTLDPNMVKVGNFMPKAVGGITNTFTYKGFSLDALIDFRIGGHVMPTGLNWMTSRGLTEESTKYMDKASGGLSYYVENGRGVQTNAAQGPNGEKVYDDGMLMEGVTIDGQPNTNVVSQAYYYWLTYNWGGPQYGAARYELFVKENSYVKFRELALSYSLPSALVRKVGAKNLSLSVFGRNLFYLYRTIKDMDAEQTNAGTRWWQQVTNTGTNPATRTVGVMLRANF
ncbi:MAG TPA: SusC/RagA family TonB-linked outer membrane protein [Chitinophagaceae bacterium]|nr:SusC/RagA family TonB-linked outer membrane protein [Chitinophagaceae bacterium]